MIKLSKKWTYAIKAMIYIAKADILVKVSDIAKNEQISESLLRRIIADLDRKGILDTIKWRNGWVRLWKKANTISIYDILVSIREELSVSDCTKWITCYNSDNCSTTKFYKTLQTWFHSLLKIYTLDKILN